MANGVPLDRQVPPYRIHLRQGQCPGDALVLTAALESLHKTYPGQYIVSVQTTAQDIWHNNPGVTDTPAYQCAILQMEYPAIHECGSRHVHFMQAFCEYLSKMIGKPVPLTTNRPHLYLSPEEQQPLEAVAGIGKYVVINAGHKLDYTSKFASTAIWQRVVDHFRGRLTFVQVGEDNPHHIHRPLDGALNLIGKTSFREFFRLVRYSTLAAGPVSFLLHVSAAFGVPYVCLAGGREDPSWISYSTTQYLHTLGALDCCKSKGCWRSRTVPLNDGNVNDRSLCQLPVIQDGEAVPKCLAMIGSAGVIQAIEQLLGGQ